MRKQKTRFWDFSSMGGSGFGRWIFEPAWDPYYGPNLGFAASAIGDRPMVVKLVEHPVDTKPEDMPALIGGCEMVSERFAEVIDRVDPGACEFQPLTALDERGVEIKQPAYYLLRTWREIECVDLARSAETAEDDPRGYWIVMPVFDPSRIPADCHLFRPAEYRVTVLVSGQMKSALSKIKPSGAFIDRVWLSTDPDAPPPFWYPGYDGPQHGVSLP